jgi:hypothetical protein
MGGEGFRGKGSGFHIQGYACRVLSVGSRGNCFRVWSLGSGVWGLGSEVDGFFGVEGIGYRVYGLRLGYTVHCLGLRL